jgi:hypothetical protein
MAIAAALLLSSCNKDVKKLEGSSTASVSSTDGALLPEPTGPAFEGELTPPSIKAGSYVMEVSNLLTEVYTGSGAEDINRSKSDTYYFDFDLSEKDGRFNLKLNISRYALVIVDEKGQTLDFDTNSDKYKDEEGAQVYYSMVGKGFSATLNADGSVAGFSGLDEMIPANSKLSSVITAEGMERMVQDVFYALPNPLEGSSKYVVKSGEGEDALKVNYAIAARRGGKLGFSLQSDPVPMPEDPIIEKDRVITYKSIAPVAGTFWVNESDRSLLEMATIRKIFTVQEVTAGDTKQTFDVTTQYTGSTKITLKG